ncbi:YraN family protein, partial [Yersinia enterocolitica]|nr:YraN family protein [Yersinia enterocolitica]
MNQRDTGTHYENQARHYLERAGLVFKAANVTYQNGEIDLIMRDGDTWVFVEVRFRRNALFGGAAASVTYSKQQR